MIWEMARVRFITMWSDLLSNYESIILPWYGGSTIHSQHRTFKLKGTLPQEHGWYSFKISGGRDAILEVAAEPLPEFKSGKLTTGYLVGNRIIPDKVNASVSPDKIVQQAPMVHLVELGLERFSRATVVDHYGSLVYLRQEFPMGPESEVLSAYQDKIKDISSIPGVTPALYSAFQWETWQRDIIDERRRIEEEARIKEERRQQLMQLTGSAEGRRELAKVDFEGAARAALALSGAELLDYRPARNNYEMVVKFRFARRRFECVVHRETLRIIDSGICLVGNDALFSLESLPPVIGAAIDGGVLHVFRHAD